MLRTKTALSTLLLLLGLSYAEPTFDRDMNHGHSKEYFQNMHKTKDFDHYYVHLIPHTHDDVGWLKTPDQYFSGTAMSTQAANVELIIDSVIGELLADPARKFSYVEMKFFTMWWKGQTEDMKSQVRMLVDEGRLELINGGWSMHDEACPHYEDMLNNMMIGHKFIKEEFGVAPRIGWQIDPFGHSSANARLSAEMGFDAWFFARMDYQDRARRLADKEMEFIWRPMYDSLGSRAQIFTHAFYDFYYAPGGFNFDACCDDDPFVDDESLETFNADTLSKTYYDLVMHTKDHYKTNHIFQVMGGDFNYMNAKLHFDSMDRMINYFNKAYPDVTLIYSTPSDYVDAVNAADIEWPTKYDDLFPYADNDESFWTGYFSSRANDKEYIRRGSHNLMASNKLFALKSIDQSVDQATLDNMMKASHTMMDTMGVNQHHDAVTGTGKQAVANEYAWLLYKSMEASNAVYQQVIESAASAAAGINSNGAWEWCFRENATYLDCPIANHDKKRVNIIVAVHNPSSIPEKYSKISLPHGKYDVFGFNHELGHFIDVSASALCDNFNVAGAEVENCDLYVEHQINGSQIGFISLVYNPKKDLRAVKPIVTKLTTVQIESDYEVLTFVKSCPIYGEIFNLTKKAYNQTFTFAFDLRWWPAFGSNDIQPSGDYIFRPQEGVYDSLKFTNPESITFQTSDVVSEIYITYSDSVTGTSAEVVVRMYKEKAYTEWFVELGSVPDFDQTGSEITVNFLSFDIDNERTFYTDANGLEMQKRVLNFRPTWEWSGSQNVSGNYYPIQTAIAIRDTQKNLQMTVMNSRSQGGSVINTGRIELMQHRRLFYDDWRGMGEGVDERDSLGNPISVPAQYFLQLFNYEEEPSLQRYIQLRQDDPLQYFFQFNAETSTKATLSQNTVASTFTNLNSVVSGVDTTDVLKVSLFPVKKNTILLRIENIGDLFDSVNTPASSQQQLKVNIEELANQLFHDVNGESAPLAYTNIKETSLTGNAEYSEMWAKKIQWRTVDDTAGDAIKNEVEQLYEITLEKQRIRVFEIEYIISTNSKADIIQ